MALVTANQQHLHINEAMLIIINRLWLHSLQGTVGQQAELLHKFSHSKIS